MPATAKHHNQSQGEFLGVKKTATREAVETTGKRGFGQVQRARNDKVAHEIRRGGFDLLDLFQGLQKDTRINVEKLAHPVQNIGARKAFPR